MLELREVFEMVTKQTEPDLDSWKQQQERQRRSSRNRKLGAIALLAAAIVGVGAFVLATRPGNEQKPLDHPPALPFVTEVPIGPQIVGLDGTPLAQLPTELWGAISVRLSPDGTTIAYVADDSTVHTIGVYGANDQQLTDAGNTNIAYHDGGDAQNHVEWSPDGTQLVYAYSGNIYVMSVDGSNKRALTNDATSKVGDFYPAWSSTGMIAYWRGGNDGADGGPSTGDAEIYVTPADGTGAATRLTDPASGPVNDIEPAWSPDGSQISYFHGTELWVMRADGGRQHMLSGTHQRGWASAWSPDGTRIAVLDCCQTGGDPTTLSVEVIDLDSGKAQRVGRTLDVWTDGNGPQWVSNDTLLINRYN